MVLWTPLQSKLPVYVDVVVCSVCTRMVFGGVLCCAVCNMWNMRYVWIACMVCVCVCVYVLQHRSRSPIPDLLIQIL